MLALLPVDGWQLQLGSPQGRMMDTEDGYLIRAEQLPVVAELIAVMALEANKRRTLMTRLSFAAVLMIALGYPGEVAEPGMMKHVWGIASSIPFVYIVYVLWTELGTAVQGQSGRVQELVRNIKLLLLATWGFYPITYLLGAGGILPQDGSAIVTIQVGYSIADIAAKCGYGIMIYHIARAKMAAEGATVESHAVAPVPGK